MTHGKGRENVLQIWVDVSETFRNKGRSGIPRVVKSLSHALSSLTDDQIEIFFFFREPFGYRLIHANREKLSMEGLNELHFFLGVEKDLTDSRIPVRREKRSVALRLNSLFQKGLGSDGENAGRPVPPDYFLSLDSFWNRKRSNVRIIRRLLSHGTRIGQVVYDVLPLSNSKFFNPIFVLLFRKRLGNLLSLADDVFTISESTSNELRSYFPTVGVSKQLKQLIMGSDIGRIPIEPSFLEGRVLDDQKLRLVSVGTIEPRKNMSFLLDWWVTEGNLLFDLTVIGRPGWKTKRTQKRLKNETNRDRGFRWISDADDAVLVKEVMAHHVGVVASSAEGFGLPIIEMASLGLPIVASDIEVFREVAPPGTIFFEANNPLSLSSALKSLDLGATRLSSIPTWHESAKALLSVIRLKTQGNDHD